MHKEYLLSPLWFNIVFEVQINAIRQRKRNKGHLYWKGRNYFYMQMTLTCMQNPNKYI